jgi:predicted nucleic acid-binding protein
MVINRLCLDTSAYSQFKRGHKSSCAAIVSARWIGVPSIVLGELRTGFALGRRPKENDAELDEFLGHPDVHVLAIDEVASRFYAQIIIVLRKKGTPLPTNDIWIASVAVREAATVLTFDDHFAAIESVASHVLELE